MNQARGFTEFTFVWWGSVSVCVLGGRGQQCYKETNKKYTTERDTRQASCLNPVDQPSEVKGSQGWGPSRASKGGSFLAFPASGDRVQKGEKKKKEGLRQKPVCKTDDALESPRCRRESHRWTPAWLICSAGGWHPKLTFHVLNLFSNFQLFVTLWTVAC